MHVSDIRSLALLILVIVGAVVGLVLLAADPGDPPAGPASDALSGGRSPERPDAAVREASLPLWAEKPVIVPTVIRPRVLHTCVEGRVEGLPAEVASGAWMSVAVQGGSLRARLDPGGKFTIWNLPCDVKHSLWLGYGESAPQVALIRNLVLGRQETREVVLSLGKTVIVTGRIESAAAEPLAGIRLTLVLGGSDWRREGTQILAVTGEDGRYVIVQPAPGARQPMTLVVDGTPLGRDVVERSLRPGAGETYTCNVRLEDGLRIAGHVFGPDGKPVADAYVGIAEVYSRERHADEPLAATGKARTDAHGHFMDDAYGPGLYRIFVRGKHGGHPFLVIRENVAAGTENLVIRFKGYGSLSLRFTDAKTGEDLEVQSGALQRILFDEGDNEAYEEWRVFSGKKSVRLDHLPAGRYRVCLGHIGYESVFPDPVTVSAGKTVGPLLYKMTPRR